MRRWHDGYGDCDVMPGSPECLCCYKLWMDDGYCQFINVDMDSIKQTTLKTLNPQECRRCEKYSKSTYKCGFKQSTILGDPPESEGLLQVDRRQPRRRRRAKSLIPCPYGRPHHVPGGCKECTSHDPQQGCLVSADKEVRH